MRGRVEPPLEDIAVDDDLAVSLSLFKGGKYRLGSRRLQPHDKVLGFDPA
jgi:hypothetical protein